MRIAFGADHAGFELKASLTDHLIQSGHTVIDLGTHSPEPVDYPDFAQAVAEMVADRRAERGVLVCGSGVGVAITANKVPGIRAAVAHDTYTAQQMVEHDQANVVALGSRIISQELAREVVDLFLEARFSGVERHQRRVNKIKSLEERYLSNTNPDQT